MANEYMVNRADLTSVANAIREKCNTTNFLVFPDDFVSSIQDMSNLNFSVVGGTAQPENPEKNTIWINTDQEITGYSFSATEPSEPSEGIVWFQIGGKNSAGINLLSENSAFIYPYFAKQYVSGAWMTVDAKSFDGDQWVDWVTYLIHGNDYCSDITGGWSVQGMKITQYGTTPNAPTLTQNEDSISIMQPGIYDGIARTSNKINLSKYKTLTFEGSAVVGSDGYGLGLGIWSAIGTYQTDYSVASINLSDSPTDAKRSLSIENLDGEYYIVFGTYAGGSFTVKALYLE